MEHRALRFQSGDDVIAEIERLRSSGYTPQGNWNLTQICDHLSRTMRTVSEGAPRRFPWFFRRFLFGPMLRRVIRTGRMARGIPAPGNLLPAGPPATDDPALIDHCIALIRKIQDRADPFPPHPLMDHLSALDNKKLQWIHAAHHLGFLAPKP
jgi:hypothetical protein